MDSSSIIQCSHDTGDDRILRKNCISEFCFCLNPNHQWLEIYEHSLSVLIDQDRAHDIFNNCAVHSVVSGVMVKHVPMMVDR